VNHEQEVAAANYPQIRILQQVNTVGPDGEQKSILSWKGWTACTPETIKEFSACAYFFGRQLHKELGVPIGLINSSWSGTNIEPWISRKGFASANRTKELKTIDYYLSLNWENITRTPREEWRQMPGFLKKFFSTYAAETKAAENWKNPKHNAAGWTKVKLPGFMLDEQGVIWYRREVQLPADWANSELVFGDVVFNDCDEFFFNGELVDSTKVDDARCSKPRAYKIPAKLVKAGRNTLIFRVTNVRSDGGVQDGKMVLKRGETEIDLAGEWRMKREFTADPRKVGLRPSVDRLQPATLYNGMIHPWTVYTVRGILWYQGCSNNRFVEDYINVFPLLIKDWRNRWNDPDMPFIYAQLAAYEKHMPGNRLKLDYLKGLKPLESPGFAPLRDVQTAVLNLPNTGMAVTIDIGDHSDIHPANKQMAGFRLAKEAMRVAYGSREVTAGPMYESMSIEGDKIRIRFSNIGSGLMVKGGKLNCFAIAGEDGKYVWADAVLDGDSVVVHSPEVPAPKNVSYAWAGYPVDPNLYNKEDFPAVPFRTDPADYVQNFINRYKK
jgi:sialate O-acetylesterase